MFPSFRIFNGLELILLVPNLSIYQMKTHALILFLSLIILNSALGQDKIDPTFEQIISVKGVYNPQISPDGKHIVFQRSAVDWKENRYDAELWISKNGEAPFQLTNSIKHSSSNPGWSPDSKWISFKTSVNDKSQIHVIRIEGGAAFPVTNVKNGVGRYEWSPDGKQIAFLQSEDKEDLEKKRKDKYGSFAVEDQEYKFNQLWIADFDPERLNAMPLPDQLEDSLYKAELKPQLIMDSVDFTINSFRWSPDGKSIAFGHQPDPLINSFFHADISIYNIETKKHKILISNPSNDGLISWSPDGSSILYSSSLDDTTSNYYSNSKLFKINVDGSGNTRLGENIDENIYVVDWNPEGIFGIVWQKTKRTPLRIDSENGDFAYMDTQLERTWSMSFSEDGKQVAFTGVSDDILSEIYLGTYPLTNKKKITKASNQLENWLVAKSEVISWKSEDGAEIEGVLHKPMDYDPDKEYPLMVIIHGGPTGISLPEPIPSYVYPMVQWLNKGALILRPNYRGSAGYGEAFRSLNVKNLGVGDAWDVLSGVKHLEKEGIIDGDKVAAMGWSQGGYISAFLTTNTDIFKAISVGAGISNWMTYYVNTDIHPFTRQYLKATPWSDKAIYEKTSPMTNITNAVTPTLIQHGEFDKRVPIANAYELFQGLQDVGVTTKLIVYKGFGHGINKPKERLAATWHNWQWINKYIWGEEIALPED